MEDVTDFQFATDGIATFFVSILGIIGNIIVLIVLSRPQMKSSINCCLQHLAVYDTLFLVMKILVKVIPCISYRIDAVADFYKAIYPYSLSFVPLINTVRTGSIWVTVGVSIERYVAVCYPLKARAFCTYKRSLLFNFLITVLVIAYNIPIFFQYVMVEKLDTSTNETYYEAETTAFGKSELFYAIYNIWLAKVMLNIIPFAALVFLNSSIHFEMKRAFKTRRKMSQQEHNDIHLAKMLFCVVAIFFVCYLPSFCFSIIESTKDGQRFQGKMPMILNLTEAVNSAVNCIVYYALASNFRKAFRQIFCNHP